VNTQATAMLTQLDRPSADRRAGRPLVWMGGHIQPNVRVQRLTSHGRADRRSATLTVPSPDDAPAAGQSIVIAQPVELLGGTSMLVPLLAGRTDTSARRQRAGADATTIEVADHWTDLLNQPLEPAIEGATLADLLAAVAGPLAIDFSGLPPVVLLRAQRRDSLIHATRGAALDAVLEANGLVVQRDMVMAASSVTEHRALRSDEHARPVHLDIQAVHDAAALVASLQTDARSDLPVKLLAAASGQVVESTFELSPAWDPALQDEPDDQYSRTTSSDFDALADVFRLWVLNEDGALNDPPYSLTGLFDEGRAVPPKPLAFGPALSTGELGRSLGLVVDRSFDAGQTWRRHPGPVINLDDRAGVYLDDDTLDTTFLAAVRSGDGRLRVTASLQSPLPIESVRWVGNPFRAAGALPTRRFNLAGRFAVRRVDSTSKFAAEVAAGQRHADTIDQRSDMQQWLVDLARRISPQGDRQHVMITTQPMWHLRIGDRLEAVGDHRADLVLVDIEHLWDEHASRLTWRSEGSGS